MHVKTLYKVSSQLRLIRSSVQGWVPQTQEGRHRPDSNFHGSLGQIRHSADQPAWQERSSHCSTNRWGIQPSITKWDNKWYLGENMPSSALENFTDEQIAQVGQSYRIGRSYPTFLLSAVWVARGSCQTNWRRKRSSSGSKIKMNFWCLDLAKTNSPTPVTSTPLYIAERCRSDQKTFQRVQSTQKRLMACGNILPVWVYS